MRARLCLGTCREDGWVAVDAPSLRVLCAKACPERSRRGGIRRLYGSLAFRVHARTIQSYSQQKSKGRLTAPFSFHSQVYCGMVLSSTFCAPCSVFCAALCVPFFTLWPALWAVFLVACPVSLAACLVS